MGRHVARMEEQEGFQNFNRKRPLGRHSHGWEDNIRMDLKERSINTRTWLVSGHERDYWIAFVNAALNLGDPYTLKLVNYYYYYYYYYYSYYYY